MERGILYAVSTGPGDPELMTRKAVKALERCAVIAYPVTQSGQALAREIAAQALDLSDKRDLPLPFSMGREADYEAAAARIEARLTAGDDVALLSLGDVSLYATGSRILRILKSRGRETVVIPGVPSFCAAAARLGVALAEGGEPLHIVPDADAAALELPGTKVFLKAGGRLPELLRAVSARGKAGMAVKNCGLSQEEIYPDLSLESPEAGYFITVLVKE